MKELTLNSRGLDDYKYMTSSRGSECFDRGSVRILFVTGGGQRNSQSTMKI